MKALKCMMYVLECKKIIGTVKVLMTSVTILILACTAAKMFLAKGLEMKNIKKALKKVIG